MFDLIEIACLNTYLSLHVVCSISFNCFIYYFCFHYNALKYVQLYFNYLLILYNLSFWCAKFLNAFNNVYFKLIRVFVIINYRIVFKCPCNPRTMLEYYAFFNNVNLIYYRNVSITVICLVFNLLCLTVILWLFTNIVRCSRHLPRNNFIMKHYNNILIFHTKIKRPKKASYYNLISIHIYTYFYNYYIYDFVYTRIYSILPLLHYSLVLVYCGEFDYFNTCINYKYVPYDSLKGFMLYTIFLYIIFECISFSTLPLNNIMVAKIILRILLLLVGICYLSSCFFYFHSFDVSLVKEFTVTVFRNHVVLFPILCCSMFTTNYLFLKNYQLRIAICPCYFSYFYCLHHLKFLFKATTESFNNTNYRTIALALSLFIDFKKLLHILVNLEIIIFIIHLIIAKVLIFSNDV